MINNVHKYFWEDPDASYYINERKYWQSVHGRSFFRYNKAKKEISEKNIVPIETIIEYVNEVLKAVGIAEVKKPIMNPYEVDYTLLKKSLN